jgi:hypothetical protein
MGLLINGGAAAPSIAETLGFGLAEVEDGRAVFIGALADRLLSPAGYCPRLSCAYFD